MTRGESPKKSKRVRNIPKLLLRLAGGTILLIVLMLLAVGLTAQWMLNTEAMRAQVNRLLADAGVTVDYTHLGINYFPLPAVVFQQVSFKAGEEVSVEAEEGLILPDLRGLLSGGYPGKILLVRPEIVVKLQEQAGAESAPEQKDDTTSSGRPGRSSGFGAFKGAVAVEDGRLFFAAEGHEIVAEGIALDLRLEGGGSWLPATSIVASVNDVWVTKEEQPLHLTGIRVGTTLKQKKDVLTVELDSLILKNPAVQLSGSFSQHGEVMNLLLTGQKIDVPGVRKAALFLAGEISPVPDIFSYLIGGQVPQITFTAQGTTAEELGEKFELRGVLQNGEVAIPDVELELRDVSGDVQIADLVLKGENLSAKMGKAQAEKGTLAIGLSEESDLFHVDMQLDADLAEAKDVVQRLIDDPWLSNELLNLSSVEGRGQGQLVLGETFSEMGVRLEKFQPLFAAQHKLLPWPVAVKGGEFDLDEDGVQFRDIQLTAGGSTCSSSAGEVRWNDELQIDLQFGETTLKLDELFPWLKQQDGLKKELAPIKTLAGEFQLQKGRLSGPVNDPASWSYGVEGVISKVEMQLTDLPAPVSLGEGKISVDEKVVGWQAVQVQSMDSTAQLEGSLADDKLTVVGSGRLGQKSVRWLEKRAELPNELAVQTPISLERVQLVRNSKGGIALSSLLAFPEKVTLDLSVEFGEEKLIVHKLGVKGKGGEEAVFHYQPGVNENLSLGFTGRIDNSILAAIFLKPPKGEGVLEGELSVEIPVDGKSVPAADGHLRGAELRIPTGEGGLMAIGKIALYAQESILRTDITDVNWLGYTVTPLRGTIDIRPGGVGVKLQQGKLCGIAMTGEGSLIDGKLEFSSSLRGEQLNAESSYSCLSKNEAVISGTMAVEGKISAKAKLDQVVSGLKGPIEMTITEGVVKKGDAFSALLEVLNVTEIVKGRLPNLSQAGLPFHEMRMRGHFEGGTLVLEEIFMDGETLELIGNGKVNLVNETVDIELLAAPLKTIDTVVKFIPGVNYLLGGNLVAIPISVGGTFDKPEVKVMSASSVSKGLLNLGERTIKLPLKLLEAILPMGKE